MGLGFNSIREETENNSSRQGGTMIAIITFLAGFYFGIIVFSLLVAARRNANNQPLAKFPIMHHFRKTDQMIRAHRARSINHSFRGAGNIL